MVVIMWDFTLYQLLTHPFLSFILSLLVQEMLFQICFVLCHPINLISTPGHSITASIKMRNHLICFGLLSGYLLDHKLRLGESRDFIFLVPGE